MPASGISAAPAGPDAEPVSPETLRLFERHAAALATRAVARMDEELTWFRTLPASHRSWVTLVAQAGIAGYVEWLSVAQDGRLVDGFRLTQAVFGTAPRELVRAVSLRRTVELLRVAISVAEEHFPALAPDPAERDRVVGSLLRYSREVAFSAAEVYAAAAESRGAWDDRLEALILDGIVRGDRIDTVAPRAAALGWDVHRPVAVLVGAVKPATDDSAPATPALSNRAEPAGPPGGTDTGADTTGAAGSPNVLAGIHGDRLVVVVAAPDGAALERAVTAAAASRFGPGSVVRGPNGTGLSGAAHSARQALSAMRSLPAWPDAPELVDAQALLAERVLAGDTEAAQLLVATVYVPLSAAGTPLLATLDAYLESGRMLDPTARRLFVHTNTVRYRLRRIAEVTGLDPWQPHDAFTLHIALVCGRLADAQSQASL